MSETRLRILTLIQIVCAGVVLSRLWQYEGSAWLQGSILLLIGITLGMVITGWTQLKGSDDDR